MRDSLDRRRRSLLGAVFTVAVVVATATPCLACSCVPASPREVFERAEVVFTGVAVEHTDRSLTARTVSTPFRVETVHKGRAGETERVISSNQTSSCGVTFRQGTRYTVFGSRVQGGVTTMICSGTTRGTLDDADKVVAHPAPLDDAANVRDRVPDEPAARGPWIATAGLMAGAVLLGLRAARIGRPRRFID